jgi:hypothetical protein
MNDYKSVKIYKTNSNLIYHVELFDNYQIVELKFKNKTILKFKDIINDNYNLSTFIRTIKNQEYIFENGKLLLKKNIRKCKFLQEIKKDIFLNENYITMDIETRTINNILIPYLLCWYDGINKKSYHINEYNNSFELLINVVMKDLTIKKYDNYKIYLHNFSNFDGIFLLKYLTNIKNCIVDPIIHEGKLINIQFPNLFL